MHTKVTLRDVACHTGFSTAAVSLALRDSPRLPVATRRLIRETARKMGYRADPVLSALAAHRWHRRAVTGGSTLAALADGNLEGRNGMAERAAAYGYRFEIFQIRDYPDPQRLADVLYARGILGIIVGQIFTRGFCAAFDWSRFIAVACSEGYERPPVHLVMPNHFLAVQQGWDWAWEGGFRRIGLALFDMPNAIDFHDRCAAFLERQQRVPSGQRVPVLAIKPWVEEPAVPRPEQTRHRDAVSSVLHWVQRHRPEIVLGFNNSFYWLLHDAGFRGRRAIPFLDLWINEPLPAATGLRLHHDEIGRRALDWLDSLLRLGERGVPEQPATLSITFVRQDGAHGSLRRRRPDPHAVVIG